MDRKKLEKLYFLLTEFEREYNVSRDMTVVEVESLILRMSNIELDKEIAERTDGKVALINKAYRIRDRK